MAPAVLIGTACCWLRLHLLSHLSDKLHEAFKQRKDAALATSSSADASARAAGASVVSQMVDLKTVYRFRDEKQVSLLLRDMRVWDEDGVPDPQAAEFGEFVLKVRVCSTTGSHAASPASCFEYESYGRTPSTGFRLLKSTRMAIPWPLAKLAAAGRQEMCGALPWHIGECCLLRHNLLWCSAQLLIWATTRSFW
jgi:hypothetical protein